MAVSKTGPETAAGDQPRLANELQTIEVMIDIYCRAHHHDTSGLCPDCSELRDYARKRLAHCPFQENKPTCGNCVVHCYRPEMRQKVREVMRYAGPKMVWRHPIMALRHLLAGRRKAAPLCHQNQSNPDTKSLHSPSRRTPK